MDYRNTLNLPKTGFPMKANLPVREPERLVQWETMGLFDKQRELFRDRAKFVLHDGPPYANGDIHAGTALNKILKDIINRYWSQQGYDAVYVPGWDTHGLPIEMRALKQLGVSQHQIDPLDLRRECAHVAEHYIGVMTEEFQRLGIMGDWSHPYITMSPAYESSELRVFADLVDRGLIYRDLKAVYWCPHCETALAEGEIEYKTHRSPSIYVAFMVDAEKRGPLPEGTRALIWTTTPWTIPANVAIALHSDLEYVVLQTEEGPLLVAENLRKSVLTELGLHDSEDLGRFLGRDLEGVITHHPYLGHEVPLILGEHVTAESGTGLVHTAPGHGIEDFEVGKRYGLPVVQPLDDSGHYMAGTPLVEGLFYEQANPVVQEKLREVGALLHAEDYDHQYAYCWRCKNPIIYRATRQWFLAIDRIRGELVEKIGDVTWDPQWGLDRMRLMISDRADWCLSRQRVWGLPIPAFYCEGCGESILDSSVIRQVAEVIGQEGSNAWWSQPASYFLPKGYACGHCGGTEFRQEKDVFDVWMDSGSSQAAVLKDSSGLKWPTDLVLEGNDQYRGWFQSLLTTGVASLGRAPYEMVMTHGMVLDQSGREMHKSLGNTIDPLDIVGSYGSDILRLWVATSDFRGDVRISDEIMRQLAESYRKIRNTFRFLLGNLSDYTPDANPSTGAVTDPLNRWALARVNGFLQEALAAYHSYHFHTMVHGLVRLMTIDLSSFYLDVIKDRLYTLNTDDALRRETQKVLYYTLRALTQLAAPVLVFTCEEVYEHTFKADGAPSSVHLGSFMAPFDVHLDPEELALMNRLLSLREVILKSMEHLRVEKVIGNSLEAEVTLFLPPDEPELSSQALELLQEMVLAARITVKTGDVISATSAPTQYRRCDRCWRYTADVTQHSEQDALCERCRVVLSHA